MMLVIRTAIVAATMMAAIAAPDAYAAEIVRQTYQNGGSACTGALPTYEGALRKRPRAIVNEGTAVAFITCSTNTEEISASKPTIAFMRLFNSGSGTVTVNCTFVNGADWEGGANEVRSVTLGSGSFAIASWGDPADDAPQFTYRTVNFSCALPPGVGVSYVGRRYRQEVGTL